MADLPITVTRYGFEWGPLTVERVCDGPFGVIVRLATSHGEMHVRATPGGKVLELMERDGCTLKRTQD